MSSLPWMLRGALRSAIRAAVLLLPLAVPFLAAADALDDLARAVEKFRGVGHEGVASYRVELRIPDDDRDYPLPPGLGAFPLRHVDDFAKRVPPRWLEHGGVMLPMYQSEALWLNFESSQIHDRWTEYPFAIKVATGKINAVTGDSWSDGLLRNPQDYMVSPGQPWIDGYRVEKGFIRQFVAMPLGSGYSAEEQLTGEAVHGGIQIVV